MTVQTAAQIVSYAQANIPDNTNQRVKPLHVRKSIIDLADSFPYATLPIGAFRHVCPELHFGCVGDGTTNDKVQFKLALAQAASLGYWVDGGGLTYGISGQLSGGAGAPVKIRNATLKNLVPAIGDPFLFFQDCPKVHLDTVTVNRGTNAVSGAPGPTAGACVIYTCPNVQISQCEIYGLGKGAGLAVLFSPRAVVKNNYIHDLYCTPSDEAETEQINALSVNYSPFCLVSENRVEKIGKTTLDTYRFNLSRGINVTYCEGARVVNNHSSFSSTTLEIGFAAGITATGNTLEYAQSFGVKLSHISYALLFADNWIKFAGNIGIVLISNYAPPGGCLASRDTMILNNRIFNSGVWDYSRGSGAVGRGIWTLEEAEGQRAIARNNMIVANNHPTTFTVVDATTFTVGTGSGASFFPDNGLLVRLTTTGTLPTGMALATDYYASAAHRDLVEEGLWAFDQTFHLYTDYFDAVFGTGTPVTVTLATGSGTHTITPISTMAYGALNTPVGTATNRFDASNTVDGAITANASGFAPEIILQEIASGSAVSLVTATAKTLTSKIIPKGRWNVQVGISFLPGATTNVTRMTASLSTTTNTLSSTIGWYNRNNLAPTDLLLTETVTTPVIQLDLAQDTTYYAIGESAFTDDTLAMFGFIHAWRV